MSGERNPIPGSRGPVREQLADIADASTGADEFVHGLLTFLGELAEREPGHPILATLVGDMGRRSAEALAAGLLHDVRSQMQTVCAHLDVMQADLGAVFDPSRLDPGRRVDMFTRFVDGLSAAREATHNAAKMMQAGYGLHTRRDEQADIAEVLDSVLESSRRMIPGRVELTLQSRARGLVEAPRSDLLRVLFNLVQNASDAVAGELGAMVMIEAWQTADLVFVSVADNGPGISAAAQAEVFELFFTTKGHGTGVGLFVCKALVEAWGGELKLTSGLAGGARLTASVPRVVEA